MKRLSFLTILLLATVSAASAADVEIKQVLHTNLAYCGSTAAVNCDLIAVQEGGTVWISWTGTGTNSGFIQLQSAGSEKLKGTTPPNTVQAHTVTVRPLYNSNKTFNPNNAFQLAITFFHITDSTGEYHTGSGYLNYTYYKGPRGLYMKATSGEVILNN